MKRLLFFSVQIVFIITIFLAALSHLRKWRASSHIQKTTKDKKTPEHAHQNQEQPEDLLALDFEYTMDRIKVTLPSIHLTLVSIVQGVVAGYLVSVVFYGKVNPENFSLVDWLNTYSSLLIIIDIWTAYMVGSSTDRYIPGWGDILIPFVYAVLQIIVITVLHQPALWFFMVGTLVLVATFARWYQFRQIQSNPTDNVYLLSRLRKEHLITRIYVTNIIYSSLFLAMGFLSERFQDIPYVVLALSLFSALLGTAYLTLLIAYMKTLLSKI